ncbi:MAG: hypothetical protein AABX52_04680 [Nanoarchaeota archaeon]
MENKKIIGIVVLLFLVGSLIFTVIWAGRQEASDAVVLKTQQGNAGDMSTEGFSSNEEMMKTHHPKLSEMDGPGCGGIDDAKATGEMTEYGITMDTAGYDQLLKDAKEIIPTLAQERIFVGLDVELPCCGVKQLQAKDNCECGHHVAMFGLAKLMTTKGYNSSQIQQELELWKKIFYPQGTQSATGAC